MVADEEVREELRKINSNSRLSEMFLSLARDLDVMEPKSPEEVWYCCCKEHAPCGSLYVRTPHIVLLTICSCKSGASCSQKSSFAKLSISLSNARFQL